MNLEQFNEILENGWPDINALSDIPFGEDLTRLQAISEEKENGHVKKVVVSMNKLLAENPISVLTRECRVLRYFNAA